MSTTLAHVDHLDGWRGLAITFLLIGHFFPVAGINFGHVGVNLFFVLSGYLMGQLLFIRHTPLPVFYRRRFSRIVPAHVCFIACVLTWYAMTGKTIDSRETLAALFFINNYVPGKLDDNLMPFGHIWSLSVEEHSYIALSLVALAARRGIVGARTAIIVLAVVFAAIGFWYWTRYSGRELEFGRWIHSEVSAYGIFASVALLLFFHGRTLPRFPAIVYPALVGLGIMLHWWSVPSPVRTTIGVGLFALAVNLLIAAPELVKRLLSWAPLRMLGLWSFSIYLWQQPFYHAMHDGLLARPVALLAAIVFGTASYYVLERPMRAYLNRTWSAPSAPRRTHRSDAA